MEKHDYVVLALVLLFGILAVLLFTGASEVEYDAYGQAVRGISAKAVTCIDTDDGANFFVRGTTYISNNKRKYFRDYCRAYDSPTLVEYYCEKGKIRDKDYVCLDGCTNGACNTAPPEPYCGDGIRNGLEECDGYDLGNMTCEDLGYLGGNLSCMPPGSQNECMFNTGLCIMPPVSACGNGIIEPGEQCDDGNNNNGDMCSNQCRLTYCGDAIIQAPNGYGMMEQCDDGNNNNNDTCTDNCTLNQATSTCIDSDGGIIPTIQGTTVLNNGNTTYNATDRCQNDGPILFEFYCGIGPSINGVYIPCYDGCSQGKCNSNNYSINSSYFCYDDDGGFVPNQQAYLHTLVNGNWHGASDYCLSGVLLKEFWCDQNNTYFGYSYTNVSCSGGCSNGACLNNTNISANK